MKKATLHRTLQCVESLQDALLEVARDSEVTSRKYGLVAYGHRFFVDFIEDGLIRRRFFVWEECKSEQEREPVVSHRVTRQKLIVRFWAATERSVDAHQLRCRRGNNQFVRTEDDDPIVVCSENN